MSQLDEFLGERYGSDCRRENARAIIEDYVAWVLSRPDAYGFTARRAAAVRQTAITECAVWHDARYVALRDGEQLVGTGWHMAAHACSAAYFRILAMIAKPV